MNPQSTVLIVDDESSARDTLEALLFREGYRLEFAHDGPQALEKAAGLAPDVILLDVMMPGMDGFEVCQQLRADPVLAEVPIILLTALDDRDSRLQGIQAGADDFITKPFDRAELRARLRTITQLNRYRRLVTERVKFEWVVEQANDGYLILDGDDQILYANPQARLYLGIPASPDIPIPNTFLALAQKQYQCQPQQAWSTWPQPLADEPDSPRYLVRPKSPNSDSYWLLVDVLVMSPGQNLVRLHDVTTQIFAQRDTWTFHAQVSHKLRTPLALLVGFLNVLQEDATLSDLQKSSVDAASRNAHRLRDEIQDILHYLEVVVQPGQSQWCDLAESRSLLAKIGDNLELDSIEVSYRGMESLEDVCVPISNQSIELILWELCENAVKFHPTQSPAVEIVVSRASDRVCIQVGDDGLTLSPEQLAKMWTPYYQAEKYFTGQVPGMGLGLSVVASLVWSVGGSCRAYNRNPGPGVVVEVELPLLIDVEPTND